MSQIPDKIVQATMTFTIKTINGFEMVQRGAAVEIPAIRSGHRAFVGVSPPNAKRNVWLMRKLEIAEEIMETNFWEPDLAEYQPIRLNTMQEVEDLLALRNLDSSKFDAPRKVDYPFRSSIESYRVD